MCVSAFKQVVRLLSASVAIGTLAVLVSVSGCRPKRPNTTQKNACACACRQQTETSVTYANTEFYSDAACSTYPGTACRVQVGTHTVSGKWESCVDNGKVWVQELVPGEIPTVVVRPDDIQPPPTPPPAHQ